MTAPTIAEPMPYGRLLSPAEAQQHLGINASTVRTWHQRRDRTGLWVAGHDMHGKPLFYEVDLLALSRHWKVLDSLGNRLWTMTAMERNATA